MKRKSPPSQVPMTEKELAQSIVHAARECGWLVARTWLSKFSPAGEPDLRMVRPPRLIYAELKSSKGKVSEAQTHWINMLRQVPSIEVYLIYPEDLEIMYRILLREPTLEDVSHLRESKASNGVLATTGLS